MPWYQPANEAGKQFNTRKTGQEWIPVGTVCVNSDALIRNALAILKSVFVGFLLLLGSIKLSTQALANDDVTSALPLLQLDNSAILMLAVFGGAMSFALLSAIWMIRERTRMIEENNRLKISLSNLRATNDRNEALVKVPGQRVVVWTGKDSEPIVLEANSEDPDSDEKRKSFVAFGNWLNKEALPWAAHCTMGACRLVVLNKKPGVRLVGVGEIF